MSSGMENAQNFAAVISSMVLGPFFEDFAMLFICSCFPDFWDGIFPHILGCGDQLLLFFGIFYVIMTIWVSNEPTTPTGFANHCINSLYFSFANHCISVITFFVLHSLFSSGITQITAVSIHNPTYFE